MRRATGAAGAAFLLSVAIVLAACSSGSSSSGPDETASSSTSSSTTTTTSPVRGALSGPTTGRTLSATEPLRVTLLGDSILYDAEPAIVANLWSTGVVAIADRTSPGFNFGHGLGFNANDDFNWRVVIRNAVAETRPEVIIAWFGIIDSDGIASGKETPEAFATSLREALGVMTANDTKVVLYGVVPSVSAAGKPTAAAMGRGTDAVMQSIATEFAGTVQFVDTTYLLSPTGAAVYVMDGQRVRKLDLIHICPDGAVRIAESIHSVLAMSWPLPPSAPGWTTGAWRTNSRYDDPPGACFLIHPGIGI